MTKIGEKILVRLTESRSPYEMMRIFNELFDNGNIHQMSQEYGISKYDLRFLLQIPNDSVLYVLNIQERLRVYYENNEALPLSGVAKNKGAKERFL